MADPGKVKVIKEMPPPTNFHEVRSFIGMCSYYRRFLPNFSQIAMPLIKLRNMQNFTGVLNVKQLLTFLKKVLPLFQCCLIQTLINLTYYIQLLVKNVLVPAFVKYVMKEITQMTKLQKKDPFIPCCTNCLLLKLGGLP